MRLRRKLIRIIYVHLKLPHNYSILKNISAVAIWKRKFVKNMLLFLKSMLILSTSLDMQHFKQDVGPMLNPLNNTLTNNKYYEMCFLLANQFNSVFTMPKQISLNKDHVTFFLSHATTTREDDLFLTDITFSNSFIIEAIRNFSKLSRWFWRHPYFSSD